MADHEPLLGRLLKILHPPHRGVNFHAQNIRERSPPAQEWTAGHFSQGEHAESPSCVRYAGDGEEPIRWRHLHQERHIEAFKPSRKPGHFEPFLYTDENENSSPYALVSADLEVEARAEGYNVSAGGGNTAMDFDGPYTSTRSRDAPRFALPTLSDEEEELLIRSTTSPFLTISIAPKPRVWNTTF
ncbi:hypothetical protein AAE478_007522 [Parahypoxylon ruwenzoriense]